MNSLWKNSAQLLSANVIAQAIGLVVYPILTRIYAVEDFGLLNLFLSIGLILSALATAQYHYAIVLPKQENQAVALVHICTGLTAAVCLMLLLTLPLSNHVADLFNAPALASWYGYLPLFVLVSSLWTISSYWFTRQKRYGLISGYTLSQIALSSLSKIGLGKMRYTHGGLIAGSLIGPAVALIISWIAAGKKQLAPLLRLRYDACLQMAKAYSNFPKFTLPTTCINSLSANLPTLLLVPQFGLAAIGWLGMAFTLAYRPVQMVTTSYYQVFYQQINEMVLRGEPLRAFFKKNTQRLLCVLVPTLIVIALLTPMLVDWLLGDGWSATARYVQWMLPWIGVLCIGNSMAYLPDIMMQQKTVAVFEIVYLVLRVMALVTGMLMGNFEVAVLGYLTVGFAVVTAQIIWYWHLIKKHDAHLAMQQQLQ